MPNQLFLAFILLLSLSCLSTSSHGTPHSDDFLEIPPPPLSVDTIVKEHGENDNETNNSDDPLSFSDIQKTLSAETPVSEDLLYQEHFQPPSSSENLSTLPLEGDDNFLNFLFLQSEETEPNDYSIDHNEEPTQPQKKNSPQENKNNKKKEFSILLKKSLLKDPEALYEIALCYQEGDIVQQNLNRAFCIIKMQPSLDIPKLNSILESVIIMAKE